MKRKNRTEKPTNFGSSFFMWMDSPMYHSRVAGEEMKVFVPYVMEKERRKYEEYSKCHKNEKMVEIYKRFNEVEKARTIKTETLNGIFTSTGPDIKNAGDYVALALADNGNCEGFCHMITLGWKINKLFIEYYYRGFIESLKGKDIVVGFKKNLNILSIMAIHTEQFYPNMARKPTTFPLPNKDIPDPENFIMLHRNTITSSAMKILLEKHKFDLDEAATILLRVNNFSAYNALILHGWFPNKQFIKNYISDIYITLDNIRLQDCNISIPMWRFQSSISEIIKYY